MITEDTKNDMIRLYSEGKPLSKVAEETGTTKSMVQHYLSKAGIVLRSVSDARRVHTANDSYFTHIDTPEKAYWLGLIYADGSVGVYGRGKGQLSFCIKAADRCLLDTFKSDIECTNPVTESVSNKGYSRVMLTITSSKLFADLAAHGVVPNKTFKTCWPTLHDGLVSHFMRGYFDGDGSVGMRNKGPAYIHIDVTGYTPFIESYREELINRCATNFVKLYKPKLSNGTSNLKYGGRLQVLRIYDFMYEGATRWLPRKKEVFDRAFMVP